jgi:hypothetical protein
MKQSEQHWSGKVLLQLLAAMLGAVDRNGQPMLLFFGSLCTERDRRENMDRKAEVGLLLGEEGNNRELLRNGQVDQSEQCAQSSYTDGLLSLLLCGHL